MQSICHCNHAHSLRKSHFMLNYANVEPIYTVPCLFAFFEYNIVYAFEAFEKFSFLLLYHQTWSEEVGVFMRIRKNNQQLFFLILSTVCHSRSFKMNANHISEHVEIFSHWIPVEINRVKLQSQQGKLVFNSILYSNAAQFIQPG